MGDKTLLDRDEEHLEGLGDRFLVALGLMEKGEIDRAAELFRGIIKIEPRLAEPRMELARILLDTGQIDEAHGQATEAVRILDCGGQWTEALPENVVLSTAYGLVGEICRRMASADEVVFGDPDLWKERMDQAQAAFRRASALDPENAHANHWTSGLDEKPTE